MEPRNLHVSKPPSPSGDFSKMFLDHTLRNAPGDGFPAQAWIWDFSPERPWLSVEMWGPKPVLFSTFCRPCTWQAQFKVLGLAPSSNIDFQGAELVTQDLFLWKPAPGASSVLGVWEGAGRGREPLERAFTGPVLSCSVTSTSFKSLHLIDQ